MQAGIEWGYRRKYKMAKIHSYRLTNRLIKLEMTLISVTGKLIIRAVGPCDQNANISHTHTHTHTLFQHFGCNWLVLIGSSLKAVICWGTGRFVGIVPTSLIC